VTGGEATDDPYVPGRGNPGYAVTGYDLDLTYRIGTNHLSGRARLSAVATDNLGRVGFDLDGAMRVVKVRVDGRGARWQQHHAKVDVTPVDVIAEGAPFLVDLQYAGQPRPAASTWGPVGWEELSDGVLAANQPNGAPTWFPCNDLPAHKAPFRIAVTTDATYCVVANGRLAAKQRAGGRLRWQYEHPEPMAPYLATVSIGRYDQVDLRGPLPMPAFVPPARSAAFRAAFARQPQMAEVFIDRFGPYPFESGYTVVLTDDALEVPLEASALSTFGTNHLDAKWERLIAHELAHQWFGNSVTAAAWRHIWLHEGFACYAEWIWSEAAGREPAAQLAARHHRRLQGLRQDLVLGDPGPEDMFDDRVYKRGALTLHALRAELGDDGFWSVLRAWTDEHRHAAATTDDFVAVAERQAGRKLSDLFGRWLWDPTLPALP
jgi:aminopeptidase N